MLREPGKLPNNFTSSGSDFSISELINDALVGGARRPPSSVTQPGWRLQQVGTRQDRPPVRRLYSSPATQVHFPNLRRRSLRNIAGYRVLANLMYDSDKVALWSLIHPILR